MTFPARGVQMKFNRTGLLLATLVLTIVLVTPG
jgi:hypothetical protein